MSKTSAGMKTTREINSWVKEGLTEDSELVVETSGQDCLLVGIDRPARIRVSGPVGDYFGALNKGASIEINGNAGRFLADTMTDGEIIVNGSAGGGLGFCMFGGTVVVRGDVTGRLGQMNKHGTIIVDGNAGDSIGLYSLGGDIIITGDTGNDTGEWLIGGNIYVGGSIGRLGDNAREVSLDEEDLNKLRTLFDRYGINHDPRGFKKVAPEKLRPFYRERRTG